MRRSSKIQLGLLLAVAACNRERHCVDEQQNVVPDELCEAAAQEAAHANGDEAARALSDGGLLLEDGGVAYRLDDGGTAPAYVSHRPGYFFWYGGSIRGGRLYGGSSVRSSFGGGSWSSHGSSVSRGGFGATGSAHGTATT